MGQTVERGRMMYADHSYHSNVRTHAGISAGMFGHELQSQRSAVPGPVAPNYRGGKLSCRASSSGSRGRDERSYKGIRYRPELNRYISEIRPALPTKRKIWLGTYKTAEEAALAFDVGVFYTGKKNIGYNFPDSVKHLPPLDDNLDQEERHVAIQKRAKQEAAKQLQYNNNNNGNCCGSAAAARDHVTALSNKATRPVMQYINPDHCSNQLNCSKRVEFYEFLPVHES